MISDQLDLWPDEVAALPWGGQSPRSVVQREVLERIKRFCEGAGVVDKSVIGCPSREAQRFDTDPAQLAICVAVLLP